MRGGGCVIDGCFSRRTVPFCFSLALMVVVRTLGRPGNSVDQIIFLPLMGAAYYTCRHALAVGGLWRPSGGDAAKGAALAMEGGHPSRRALWRAVGPAAEDTGRRLAGGDGSSQARQSPGCPMRRAERHSVTRRSPMGLTEGSTSSFPHGLESHFTLRSHSTVQGTSPPPCHMLCGRGVVSSS